MIFLRRDLLFQAARTNSIHPCAGVAFRPPPPHGQSYVDDRLGLETPFEQDAHEFTVQHRITRGRYDDNAFHIARLGIDSQFVATRSEDPSSSDLSRVLRERRCQRTFRRLLFGEDLPVNVFSDDDLEAYGIRGPEFFGPHEQDNRRGKEEEAREHPNIKNTPVSDYT